MLLTILSSLTGIFGGAIPTGIKLFREHQDNKQEMARMEMQFAHQKELGTARLEETVVSAEADALMAAYRHDTATGRGASQWVVNIRALTRVVLSILVLSITAFVVVYSFTNADTLATTISLITITDFMLSATMNIISFWFTDRALSKTIGGQG